MLKLIVLILPLFTTVISGLPTTELTFLDEDVTTTPTSTTTVLNTTKAVEKNLTKHDECDVSLLVLDATVSDVFFMFQPNHFGFNNSQDMFDNYCSKVPGWLKDGYSYRPCLPPFPRTILNIVMNNLRKAYKRFCLDAASMQLALKHLKCLDKDTKADFIDIGDKITSMLYHASNMSDLDKVIPGLCCGANHLLVECKEDLEKMCKSRAMDDTDEFMIDFVKSILSDALDLMCGKFSSPKECHTLAPDLYQGILESIAQRRRHETSMIIPLLGIIRKLDGTVNL